MIEDAYREPAEIQAPVAEEIRKSRSCIRRACFSGCGCGALLVILTFSGLWLFTPAKPEKVTALPEHFPADFPLYKKEDIARIEHLSTSRARRAPEAAAFVPKMILAPILIAVNAEKNTATGTPRFSWRAFKKIMASPLADYHNTTIVSWRTLNAEPDFIEEWYRTECEKQSFTVERAFTASTTRKIACEKQNISGAVVITDSPQTPGTDEVAATVLWITP